MPNFLFFMPLFFISWLGHAMELEFIDDIQEGQEKHEQKNDLDSIKKLENRDSFDYYHDAINNQGYRVTVFEKFNNKTDLFDLSIYSPTGEKLAQTEINYRVQTIHLTDKLDIYVHQKFWDVEDNALFYHYQFDGQKNEINFIDHKQDYKVKDSACATNACALATDCVCCPCFTIASVCSVFWCAKSRCFCVAPTWDNNVQLKFSPHGDISGLFGTKNDSSITRTGAFIIKDGKFKTIKYPSKSLKNNNNNLILSADGTAYNISKHIKHDKNSQTINFDVETFHAPYTDKKPKRGEFSNKTLHNISNLSYITNDGRLLCKGEIAEKQELVWKWILVNTSTGEIKTLSSLSDHVQDNDELAAISPDGKILLLKRDRMIYSLNLKQESANLLKF